MEKIISKPKLCILAEGYEENAYLTKLFSFPNQVKENYEIKIINAKGKDKLINRYQNIYQSNRYERIYIFADGDNDPNYINKTISAVVDIKGDPQEVLIYVNPVTLQIVLSHFKEVRLTKIGKKSNTDIIERLTGIKNYSAREEQITNMMNMIKYSSIKTMLINVSKLPRDIYLTPSSNAYPYLKKVFENMHEN